MTIKSPLSLIVTAIAISFGLIVLAGYFIQFPLLAILQKSLLQWFVILAAIALLVGVANLFTVHWVKASSNQIGSFYSILLVISLIITVAVAGYLGPTADWSLWLYNYIQVPVETSLMAILSVVLVYAGVRLLRKRPNVFSAIFIGTGLLMLLGSAPMFGVVIPGLHGSFGIKTLIAQIPAVAGARGILLGVALGTIATGLRVLMGADRPFRG
jgi:hypothetical protein